MTSRRIQDRRATKYQLTGSLLAIVIEEVIEMKLSKLIGVFAVIGIGLWGGTVLAQSQKSRVVKLDCVSPNPVVYCGFDGGRGQLKINLWEIGSSNSEGNSPIVPADGDPHPLAELNVVIPCQQSVAPSWAGDNYNTRQFYALYVQLNYGDWMRIFSFNTHCASWRFHSEILLPEIDPPNSWFEDTLDARIVLEVDDGINGIDDPNNLILASPTEF